MTGLNNGKHLHVIKAYPHCEKYSTCSFNYHIRYKHNKEYCDPFLLQLLIFLWSLYLPQKWILQGHIHIPKQSNHLQSNYNGNKMKLDWTNFRFISPVYTYYMYIFSQAKWKESASNNLFTMGSINNRKSMGCTTHLNTSRKLA